MYLTESQNILVLIFILVAEKWHAKLSLKIVLCPPTQGITYPKYEKMARNSKNSKTPAWGVSFIPYKKQSVDTFKDQVKEFKMIILKRYHKPTQTINEVKNKIKMQYFSI